MLIEGLKFLTKLLLHLHTQYNREIPWGTIDVDFMNLNQSAHGDREYGFIYARMDIPRKIVTEYCQGDEVIEDIVTWTRAACANVLSKKLKVTRFGDNMREVAVTECDKVWVAGT